MLRSPSERRWRAEFSSYLVLCAIVCSRHGPFTVSRIRLSRNPKAWLTCPPHLKSGLHGYTHEAPASLSEAQERAVLARSIDVYKRFTGRQPAGYIAPSWQAGSRTIRLLEESGIRYGHSLMAHDSQPHWAADFSENVTTTNFEKRAEDWMVPMRKAETRDVVEIPGNWHVTDFGSLFLSCFP